MKIKHALQEYLLEIEVRKYTQKTIRSYRNNLNLFVRYLDEEADVFDTEDLTLAAVRKFSAYMVGRLQYQKEFQVVQRRESHHLNLQAMPCPANDVLLWRQ